MKPQRQSEKAKLWQRGGRMNEAGLTVIRRYLINMYVCFMMN